MKKSINKILAIAISILFVTSITAVAAPQADAAMFPGTTIPTWAYLEVVPDTIGLGQSALMVMWIDKPPPTANGIYGDRWIGMTIEITKPDGSKTTIGPFQSDDAGGYTAVWTPTELGTYTAQMKFPGEEMTGSQGNPGFPNLNSASVGDVYGASESEVFTFYVQDEPFTTLPENALPTDYWQHPVQAFNHYWAEINGNWLGLGDVEFGNTGGQTFAGCYNLYTAPVLAPHIVWSDSLVPGSNVGGQLGGELTDGVGTSESNFYSGFQYQPKFQPIVMNGILYYQLYPNYNSLNQGFRAVDLRTGETLWEKNYNDYFSEGSQDILLCGQNYIYKTMNTYGAQSFLWATRSAGYSSSYLDCFDAATGNYLFTVEGGGGSGSFGRQEFMGDDGSLLQLYLGSTTVDGVSRQTLNLWNSSKCTNPSNSQFFSFTMGGTYQYDTGIEWTTILPNQTSTGDATPRWIFDGAGHSVWDEDTNTIILTGSTGMYSSYGWNPGWVMHVAVDMDNGQQLWLRNITGTPFAATMVMPGTSDGTFLRYTKETFTFDGFSVATGEHEWTTEPMINPLAYYDQTSAVCADGKLYTWTFGGEVYCFDMTNGAKIWNFSTGETADTPYGVNPLWIIGNYEATWAGGVFYVETGHDYGPPLFSGAKIYALNATTGELLWDVLNFASGSSLPVVYGYMLSFNAYDNSIYCWGKGQTATTVETAAVINNNDQILIKGTVTDQSPGETCLGIPAAGTPAIADESMDSWMEYLYMQMPKPTNATGVPVTLSVIDPNGNYFVIGTTTTDINGQYSYVYTPDVPGTYAITASFCGTNSYFSSYGQTMVAFDEPAAATAEPTAAPQSAADMYFIPAIAGLFILVIIVLVLLVFLMMKKRP
jgi:outer membrane protein assembly factor BamB